MFHDQWRRNDHRIAHGAHHQAVGKTKIPATRTGLQVLIEALPGGFISNDFNRTH